MKEFLGSIEAQPFTIAACIIGYALSDNFTPNELNSLGNWLILVGQYLETVANQQILLNSVRNNTNNNTSFANTSNDIDRLKRMVDIMQQQINDIKNTIDSNLN